MHNLKLGLISSVIAFSVLIPAAAFAQTAPSDNENDGATTSSAIACPQLSSTLYRGQRDSNTNGQVSDLQAFLTDYLNLNVDISSGYFGVNTQKYVKEFQAANGIEQVGYVGKLTRAAIAKACSGLSPDAATVTPDAGWGRTLSPSCTISADRSSYNFGDTINFSWTSTNASYAVFVADTSGKDNLQVPGDKLATSGSQQITANVYGNPFVTLKVVSTRGESATCTATVGVIGAPTPLGNLNVDLNTGLTPANANTIAGSQGTLVGAFKFKSTGSAYTVTNLQIGIGSADNLTNVSGVTIRYNDANNNSISHSQGAVKWKAGSAAANFTGESIYVPANDVGNVYVYVNTPTIASGAKSGASIAVSLSHADSFRAVDSGGNVVTSVGTQDIASNVQGGQGLVYVRKSVPTFNFISTRLATPSTGAPLYKFTISADAAGAVELSKIGVALYQNGVQVTNLYLVDDASGQRLNDTAAYAPALPYAPVSIDLTKNTISPQYLQIAAGSTKTIDVYGTVSGWDAAGDSLAINLIQDGVPVANTNAAQVVGSMAWSDRSSSPHSLSSSDWTNGYLIFGEKGTAQQTYTYGGTTASITLTAPNGGEQWEEAVINSVTWTPYNYNPDVNPSKDVTAYLEVKCVNPEPSDWVSDCEKTGYHTLGKVEESGKASIHWITGELNSATQSSNLVQPGQYYIRVVNNVTGAWDRSDAPFTVLPRSLDLKVNGSDGPVNVAQNQKVTATWTVKGASNCNLYNAYDVPGGTDGISNFAGLPPSGSKDIYVPFQQNWWVGMNCVKPDGTNVYDYVATNQGSQTASIQVLSPNGGEQLTADQPYTIRWQGTGLGSVAVAVYKNDQWLAWINKNVIPSGKDVDALVWTPTAAVLGKVNELGSVYKIYVTGQKSDGSGYVDDKSDGTFSVASMTSIPSATVNVSGGPVARTVTAVPVNGLQLASFKLVASGSESVLVNRLHFTIRSIATAGGLTGATLANLRAVVGDKTYTVTTASTGLYSTYDVNLGSGAVLNQGGALYVSVYTDITQSSAGVLDLWFNRADFGLVGQTSGATIVPTSSNTTGENNYYWSGYFGIPNSSGTTSVAPSCSIAANPSTVGQDQNFTLSWTSTNATSANLNLGVGSVQTSGTYSLGLGSLGTQTATLTVTGPGGTAICSVNVTVQALVGASATIDQSSLSASSRSPVISGTATGNVSAIYLAVSDLDGNNAFASDNATVSGGRWSVQLTKSLANGSYKVTVVGPGYNALATGTLTVTVVPPAPTPASATIDAASLNRLTSARTFTGTASGVDTLTVLFYSQADPDTIIYRSNAVAVTGGVWSVNSGTLARGSYVIEVHRSTTSPNSASLLTYAYFTVGGLTSDAGSRTLTASALSALKALQAVFGQ